MLLCCLDSRFTQQELPACKPILTPMVVMAAFISIGVVFIPIGLVTFSESEAVVEVVDRYDRGCIPSNYTSDKQRTAFIQDEQTEKTCLRNIIVPKKMKQPIFIYYELDDYYQNHRRYVKSRSDKQLQSPASESETTSCSPEGEKNNKPIVPCGLIAWSLFNDTYAFSLKDKALPVNRKNIAWLSDRNKKFGSNVYPKNFQSGDLIGGGKLNESIPLNQQEDLLVWMRTAALPHFRKLYGRIEVDLEANDQITVEIGNNYNTYSFGGKKSIVISTTSWIGGKNNLLGAAFITVGAVSFFCAISFIVMYMIRPRQYGDPAYLSWNRNSAEN
ncbi:hypothetical protein Leryth_013031 [Lithospermum erythrorhizon]|nr:hypothetical protein Leryth_013031 [Lithospermum erythrorhizon]